MGNILPAALLCLLRLPLLEEYEVQAGQPSVWQEQDRLEDERQLGSMRLVQIDASQTLRTILSWQAYLQWCFLRLLKMFQAERESVDWRNIALPKVIADPSRLFYANQTQ